MVAITPDAIIIIVCEVWTTSAKAAATSLSILIVTRAAATKKWYDPIPAGVGIIIPKPPATNINIPWPRLKCCVSWKQ